MSANLSRRASRLSINKGSNSESIIDCISQDKRFSKLARLLSKSGNLKDDLDSNKVSWTFFAPTDAAITKFEEIVKKNDSSKNPHQPPMIEEILSYHMVRKEHDATEFFDGQLLISELVDRQLGGKSDKQRIRVTRRLGGLYLNMFTRVEETLSIPASNGLIYAIDWVLLPPVDSFRSIFELPFVCSTFASALQNTEVSQVLERERGTTVFVPTDSAWKEMNFTDLVYLFSDMGAKDLKKICEYHVCPEINYASTFMEDVGEEFEIPSMLKSEMIRVKVTKRSNASHPQNKGKDSLHPADYMIVCNEEVSVIRTDLITANGNAHLINSVLIPESVVLPSKRQGGNRSLGGFDLF